MSKIKRLKARPDTIIFYCLLLLWPIAQFCVFYIGVNAQSIMLSFMKYDIKTYTYSWAGFDNFIELFNNFRINPDFPGMLKNSAITFFISLIIGTPFNFIISYYLFRNMWGTKVFKILFMLPGIVSGMAICILFRLLVGVALPETFGITNLIKNYQTSLGTCIFFSQWISFGGSYLIYVGTMGDISDSLLESARLDGCSYWKELWYIVFPMLWPTFSTFFVGSLTGFFTSSPYLFEFYEFKADSRIQTLGYYLFRETKLAGPERYTFVSCFGLLLTMVCIPIVLSTRYLMNKFGPSKE